MSKILVTPVKQSGVEPYEVVGTLSEKCFHYGKVYYIAGQSFPAEIVTIIEE